MNSGDCIFCKIIKKELPGTVVYEDQALLAILDITPINAGHVLVLPKTHYENLYDMNPDVLKEMIATIQKIAVAVKKATNADGINIGMNNGSAAGQVVPHAHVHVIPRFKDDGYKLWESTKTYRDGETQAMAEKIKDEIK